MTGPVRLGQSVPSVLARRQPRPSRSVATHALRSDSLSSARCSSSSPRCPPSAAERMWVGFQDDPSFRWRTDRAAMLDEAVGLERRHRPHDGLLVDESRRRRPANPSNPFDPAYRWDDLDELVRSAQFRGLETLLTIWGTPNWANGGKGPNYAPTRLSDMTAFARALASRYSGRNPGFPFVRFYSVWNEPNLEQFLAPTFDKQGQARVAAQLREALPRRLRRPEGGEPHGRSRHRRDVSARPRQALTGQRSRTRIAPATFAKLLSTSGPRMQFDGVRSITRTRCSAQARCRRRGTRTSISRSCRSSRRTSTSGSEERQPLDH